MSEAAKGANVVVVPGPSATTDGKVRVATEAAGRAIMALQGAARFVRTLPRTGG